jgi:hypothetical protein
MGEDIEFPVSGDIPPAVPDGHHYEIVFLRAEQTSYRGRQKVYLWFKMLTPGEHCGREFYMACNVAPKGKWTASYKFWVAWVLAEGRRPTRVSRMSVNVFKNKVFRARMRTVRKTANQTERTPAQQYSVVDELLEIMAGQ